VTPSLRLVDSSPADTSADVLVVGIRAGSSDDSGGPELLPGTELPPDVATAITADLATVGASGAADATTRLPAPEQVSAASVLAVGVGSGERLPGGSAEALRRAAGAATRALSGVGSAVLALPSTDAAQARAVAEGALMGAYAFTAFRSSGGTSPLAEVLWPGGDEDAAQRASAVADAVGRARDWVNTPAGDLPPAVFADQIADAAGQVGLIVEVLDEAALAEGGYGGILGVGRGSANPPRLVRLEYRPEGATRHLVLVGKGITFDTGGLSLKPAEAMIGMKTDMSGAAAASAAAVAVAAVGAPVSLTVYAALAENMPSGTATRPQDVLRIYGGQTVEVLNTDAEGRLVMADALARAGEDSPDLLVDIATLTGACMVALGQRVAGVMGNASASVEAVEAAADAAGESVWHLPIPEEMRSKLDSQVADIANIGNRYGGALQAAAFLADFVADGVDWAHLDIAGPARNTEGPHGYTPKGATGFGVRTLVALAEQMAQ
jgi:leucyl aminopeptidase